jgi:hypothetical protein
LLKAPYIWGISPTFDRTPYARWLRDGGLQSSATVEDVRELDVAPLVFDVPAR